MTPSRARTIARALCRTSEAHDVLWILAALPTPPDVSGTPLGDAIERWRALAADRDEADTRAGYTYGGDDAETP